MANNPLFRNALRVMRQQAVSQFRQSELGQLAMAMQTAAKSGNGSDIDRLQKQMRSLANKPTLGIEQNVAAQAMREVEKYARGGLKKAVVDGILGALGPLGDLIGAFLRPGGRPIGNVQNELKAAADMLEMFGYKVTKPGTGGKSRPIRPGRQVSPRTDFAEEMAQRPLIPPVPGSRPPTSSPAIPAPGGTIDTASARKHLEDLGFKVIPPSQENRQPATPRQHGTVEETSGTHVTVRIQGQKFIIPKNDPLLTGKMVPVKSSNVHSIGFMWNDRKPESGTLKVRFLDKRSGTAKAGATYYYYDVSPLLFHQFRQAASKGKWVWDHLRIRGTVSGHQKRYSLAGITSDGYVPRKATRLGDEEWYLPRTVKSTNGQTYVSALQAQMVQKLNRRPPGPNRGQPDRGKPDRGR